MATHETDHVILPPWPGDGAEEGGGEAFALAEEMRLTPEPQPIRPLGAEHDLAQKAHRQRGDGLGRVRRQGRIEGDAPGIQHAGGDRHDHGAGGERAIRRFHPHGAIPPEDALSGAGQPDGPGIGGQQIEQQPAEPRLGDEIAAFELVQPEIGKAEKGRVHRLDEARLPGLDGRRPGVFVPEGTDGGGEIGIGKIGRVHHDRMPFSGGRLILRLLGRGRWPAADSEPAFGAKRLMQRETPRLGQRHQRVLFGHMQPGGALVEPGATEQARAAGARPPAGLVRRFEDQGAAAGLPECYARREPGSTCAHDQNIQRGHRPLNACRYASGRDRRRG